MKIIIALLKSSALPAMLILLLAALRRVADGKIPRKFFYYLWQAAALRLLVPITFPLPILPPRDIAYTPQITPPPQTASPGNSTLIFPESLDKIAALIYIFGAVSLALYFCIGHIKGMNRYRYSLPLSIKAENIKEALKLRRSVEIRTCEQAVSPLVYGIFRPVVILPKGTEEGESLRHILAHELVHVKRQDLLWKLIYVVALCIYWINPAVWLLYALSARDIELTCDEETIEKLSFSPKAYAMTLISMEERLLPMQTAFGQKPVRERIERLLGNRPAMGAAAGFAAVIIGAAFFTAVQHMPPRVVYVTVTESVDNIPVTGESFAAYETEIGGSPELPDDTVWEEAVNSVTFEGIGNGDYAMEGAALYINEVTLVTADNIAEEMERYAIAYNEDRAAEALTYTIAVAENAAEDTTLCTKLYKILKVNREEVCTAANSGSEEISLSASDE